MEIFEGSPQEELQIANHKAVSRINRTASPIRSLITEHLQVRGLENVYCPQSHHLIKGPHLLLFNHDTRHDFFNLPQVWQEYVPELIIKAVSRVGILDVGSFRGLDQLFGKITQSVLSRNVVRASQDMSEVEKEALKERNKEAMEIIHQELLSGVSYIMAPTGTTHGDGCIPEVKKGAYKLSYFEKEGETKLIKCLPLGLTYDFLVGSRNRFNAVFGKPFTSHPELRGAEGAEDFASQFRKTYTDLNTFTTSQIGSKLIYNFIEKGKKAVSLSDLEAFTESVVTALMEEGAYLDEGLEDEEIRSWLIERFYDHLIKLGYLQKNGEIQRGQAMKKAELKNFKKENPLLFTFNRIETVVRSRSLIQDIFNQSLANAV